MLVYSCPSEVPAPKPDYANYDHAQEQAREAEHQQKLKVWLIENGYTGPNTGKVARFGVADGCAVYMLGEAPKGRRSCLVHLPYGDGYHYPDVKFLPKTEVLKRILQEERFAAIFATREI